MRPIRLHIAGFGVFREPTVIGFDDVDLFALVGATGAGKSTVIDAITFSLYGSVARYERNNIVAPAINQRSNEARLQLDFELGGTAYRAVRVVRRTDAGATTREARLERGDEVLAASAKEMTDAVVELLGLDVDQFNRTVVLPQGQFSSFLRASSGERQKTLRQLLGFDRYARIGAAARNRANDADARAAALLDDIAARAADLTDRRRAELVDNSDGLRERSDAGRALVADLDDTVDALRIGADERDRLDLLLQQLDDATPPAGLVELAESLAVATADHDAATNTLAQSRQARVAAQTAVDEGPDRAITERVIEHHRAVDDLHERRDAAIADRDTAAADHDRLVADVDTADSHQAELDAVESSTSTKLAAAEQAVADLDPPSIDRALTILDDLRTADEHIAELERELDAATAPLDDLQQRLANADRQRDAAVAELDRRRELAGVAAHAHLLVAGEACPLCQQRVDEVPEQSAIGVDEAQALVDTADAARRETAAELDDQRQAMLRIQANHDAAAERRERLRGAAADLPDRAALDERRARATTALDDVDRLRTELRTARAAATAHRSAAHIIELHRNRQAASTRLSQLDGQIDEITAAIERHIEALVGTPDRADAEESLTTAVMLSDELRDAHTAVEAAETAAALAAERVATLDQQRDRALDALHAARQQVAALGPPSADGSITERWAAFDDWRSRQRDELATERDGLGERLEQLDRQLADRRTRLNALAADIEHDDSDKPARLVERLADAATRAAEQVRNFDERREQLGDTQRRADELTERAAVAHQLGNLLRANRFEQWLMRSVLEQLTERATERLFELSSGQYSLVLDDDSFAVRDHTNADEIRPAMTLSGGETFLASLALALALSDATADLAADGAPRIESIFLDEGFGTLDPATLDVVATAIEELGAGGRMVGIITHIRELADRMPVRFDVAKTPNGSTVQRLEV